MSTGPRPRSSLPTGIVTLMFTDVVGSTALLERLQEQYPAVVERHRTLLRDMTVKFGGCEVDASGDAFFCVFDSVRNAVGAAVGIQVAFGRESWPEAARLSIRMGLHTGEPRLVDGRYYGLDVHLAARIAATANGGQVLLSSATRHLTAERDLPTA